MQAGFTLLRGSPGRGGGFKWAFHLSPLSDYEDEDTPIEAEVKNYFK
jgi:hypothetical protein